MSSKLITVFGATGQQGNAVAKALLAKNYKVRAVTRSPDNARAQELKTLGAEIAQVKNMDNMQELEQAIQGSYGVFAVTNYWGMLGENPKTAYDREIAQGKAIGDICKKFNVQHLVYSGLEHVKAIMGKPCPHLDTKGIVEKYLDENGIPNTSTRYSFYFDNFVSTSFFPIQKQDDGTYAISFPVQKPMDGVSVADGGPAVAAIFDNPSEYIGKKIEFSGEKLTGHQYAEIFSKVTGKTVKFNYVPPEVFAKFPFPGADDLATMFEFFDFKDGLNRSTELMRKLNPATLGFEAWAQQNKDKLGV